LIYYSLTGTSESAVERIKRGLETGGYAVTTAAIEPDEPLFRFPLSVWRFLRIMVRAVLRRPARIKPLDIPAGHANDLVVIASQTWFVGMSAPVEAVFEDPAGRAIFEGRDVATVNVCRGLWRRSQAMLVRWLERSGANIVGARAYRHIGWEPSRLFSLVFYLIYREPGRPRWLDGLVQPRYGLSDEALSQLEAFGRDLAARRQVATLGAMV
jgi:hypothetical protein